MLLTTPEERYWLEANWATTSRATLRLIKPLSVEVIDEILDAGQPTEPSWSRFVNGSARALDRKRAACSQTVAVEGRGSRATMFASAISLFGDPSPLRNELIGARERLGGERHDAIVWSCLRSGLFRMRHRMTTEVENRSKTWRRLKRISDEVLRDRVKEGHVRDGDTACAPEHYQAVADYIGHVYPTDHNLPSTADRVEGFFEEFCDEFEVFGDFDAVYEDEVEFLPDLTRGRFYLDGCIEELQPGQAAVYAVSHQRGPVIDLSVTAFCARTGMDRRRFYHLRDQAVDKLSDCVRGKFNARSTGAPL